VLDVLAQVQATVQREVLAAITLNSTFADMVLDPIQVPYMQCCLQWHPCSCFVVMCGKHVSSRCCGPGSSTCAGPLLLVVVIMV
jgi:hypothetical protein